MPLNFQEASKISSPFSNLLIGHGSGVQVPDILALCHHAPLGLMFCIQNRGRQLLCGVSVLSSSSSFRLSSVTLGFVRTRILTPWIWLFNPVFTFDATAGVCKIAPSDQHSRPFSLSASELL